MAGKILAHLPPAEAFAHGTRARYVSGCRCTACRKASSDVARDRGRQIRAAAIIAEPSGPAGVRLIVKRARGGAVVEFRLPACPGAIGKPCVVEGGAILRRPLRVCVRCAERVSIWNGLVSAEPARLHLLALSAKGIGKHAVADASDVAHTILCNIKSGKKKTIRAQTARRILGVDEAAVADGALVSAKPTRKLVKKLVKEGLTKGEIAKRLGYRSHCLQLVGKKITARNANRVAKLYRAETADDVEPVPVRRGLDEGAKRRLLTAYADGVDMQDLAARFGMSADAISVAVSRARVRRQGSSRTPNEVTDGR